MSRNPRFRRLRLRNWKNFLQVDVAVGNRLFLVGANAAGKSNFLDTFRFLRDVALPGNGFREAVLHPRRGGVAGIRCLAARRNPDVEITVDLEGEGGVSWRYEIAFHQDNRRRPRIRRERVSRSGEALVDRPNEEDAADPERLTQTYLEQVSVNQPFRDLAAFFGSIRYLHLVPQLVREPDRSVGRTNDPFGGDFLEQVAKTPERTRTARLRRIQHALCVAVPQLERAARGAPVVECRPCVGIGRADRRPRARPGRGASASARPALSASERMDDFLDAVEALLEILATLACAAFLFFLVGAFGLLFMLAVWKSVFG